MKLNRTKALVAGVLYLLAAICLVVGNVKPSGAAPMDYKTGIIKNEVGSAQEGLTLFAMEELGKIFLVDMAGNPVHEWNLNAVSSVVRPLPFGHLLAYKAAVSFKDKNVSIVELDWDGNIVWSYNLDPATKIHSFHHDVQRSSDGSTYILATRVRTVPSISPNRIRDDVILQIDPTGKLLWTWSAADHYEGLGLWPSTKATISKGKFSDIFHTNSIQILPPNQWEATDPRFKAGNILVSQRNTDRVFLIDRTKGRIAWTMKTPTVGQHHARMLPANLPGAGNITIFDNGGKSDFTALYRVYSLIQEVNPVTDKPVWTYRGYMNGQLSDTTFFSQFRSSAQRLPNGNTLITESEWGRLFEVTPEGRTVWEYVSPYFAFSRIGIYTNHIYRAYRVPSDWKDTDSVTGFYPW